MVLEIATQNNCWVDDAGKESAVTTQRPHVGSKIARGSNVTFPVVFPKKLSNETPRCLPLTSVGPFNRTPFLS